MSNDRKKMAEAIWLHYFNLDLFQKGIITERAYFEMRRMIQNRK